MAFALGLIMLALATTSMLLAQEGRDNAALRKESAASLLMSDSAIAEILIALSAPKNSVLLGKNYDRINDQTNRLYLGPDGVPNSGDEANRPALNEWNVVGPYTCQSAWEYDSTHSLNFSGTLGARGEYEILAYRFDPDSQTGFLLVEGTYDGIASTVHITLDIAHDSRDFPGVLADSVVHWQGRSLTGKNSNVQFNPTDDDYPDRLRNLVADSHAAPSDGDRERYLNMIWSGTSDAFPTDPVDGKLVACDFNFDTVTDRLPYTAKGEELGDITGNQLPLTGAFPQKEYQANSTLTGTDEIAVDTTNGPVHLYIRETTQLSGSAKIRNYRTDGRPPQVGDLRIVQSNTALSPLRLYDQTCIENAFVYAPEVDVHLFTTGDGCAGPSDSNILGVIWAEDVENSAYGSTDFDSGDGPTPIIAGTSGIEVPDDVSSLIDELELIGFPVFYRISGVTAWNDVNL